ncbi:hypothetical protein ACFFF5_02565 [Lederbergia wuyishanensis]|uniref:Uncharacterized protein n=1 Tax=Lederbergia wuyishanensis TaxID=1347903 RepID=A0ABU0D0J4_9BACI|nr:hypothetical protein [Lederbergia wuyishanensis]MCJ8006535.1 hypothetical protein [Lederbergia wuyishanensis]MDQ0341914.1 hypothetical protein [Lederbergia wuyishanensis]
MDTKLLDDWIKNIKVKNIENEDVEVVNKSPLVMIGKGRQGAVFQIDNDTCVKVFGNSEDCDRENYALSLGQRTDLFPKIHAKGSNYIVMDLIKGIDVREYLQSQPLTEALSEKLVKMLITFKEIGFQRIDHHKRQIFIQEDGSLKVIDVSRTVWRDRVYPYPRKLMTSLGEKNKALFLSHVQELAPELYDEWIHYIRMEEISRQITQSFIAQKPQKNSLQNLSSGLLTTNDEKQYVILLEGLSHKVFKEEWIKAMLARGYDIDSVMKKIDEHWDNYEQSFNENKTSVSDDSGGYEYEIVTQKQRKPLIYNEENATVYWHDDSKNNSKEERKSKKKRKKEETNVYEYIPYKRPTRIQEIKWN